MVIRSAFLGARRFEHFTDGLGIPRNVLTERLARLVDEGIMEKRAYQERPMRYQYHLTDKGIALYPVIVSMLEWGNRWLDWDVDPPVHLVDRETGAATRAGARRPAHRQGARAPQDHRRLPGRPRRPPYRNGRPRSRSSSLMASSGPPP